MNSMIYYFLGLGLFLLSVISDSVPWALWGLGMFLLSFFEEHKNCRRE